MTLKKDLDIQVKRIREEKAKVKNQDQIEMKDAREAIDNQEKRWLRNLPSKKEEPDMKRKKLLPKLKWPKYQISSPIL